MFKLLPILFLAAAIAAQDGRPPSPLDQPVAGRYRVIELPDHGKCGFIQSLEQALRPTPLRLGFENLSDCLPSGWTLHAAGGDLALQDSELDFDGLSPRQALDRLIEMRPEFSWKEIDGVVVVRPVAAWADPANLLHRPVAAFTIDNTHVHYVLHVVTEAAQPPVFVPHVEVNLSIMTQRYRDPSATSPIDTPVSVSFPGGTLLDALNTAAGSVDGIWQVGYPHPNPHISIHLRDFEEGTVGIPVRLDRTATKR